MLLSLQEQAHMLQNDTLPSVVCLYLSFVHGSCVNAWPLKQSKQKTRLRPGWGSL
jgi:hypothetical protein